MEKKDLVDNRGQEEEEMQDWRSVYEKFFVNLHVYVYLYTQFQKVPSQVECWISLEIHYQIIQKTFAFYKS